jgi:putative tryptophan/tyrosine transport system substrate-binding protein
LFDLVEKPLDQVAGTVKKRTEADWVIAIAFGRDIGPKAPLGSEGSNPVGIVPSIRQQHCPQLGYVDGQNAEIVYRFAEEHLDRFPVLAAELVGLKPDVILATVTPAPVATRALTNSIPIVCPLLADAINLGLIATDSRPGGNVTGVSFRTAGLTSKQVELALQMIPDVVRIGFLVNVASGVIIDRQELESTCQRLRINAVPAEIRAPNDLDAAFQGLANDHVRAVIVLVDGMLFSERNRIAGLAAAARLPAIYGFRDHVDAGGLASLRCQFVGEFSSCGGLS